jgi:hypothetical protein
MVATVTVGRDKAALGVWQAIGDASERYLYLWNGDMTGKMSV